MEAEDFINRASRLVNGIENLVDQTWSEFQQTLDEHTDRANRAMRMLVVQLPAGKDGLIDFKSRNGQRRRQQFLMALGRVYANWESQVLGDLDIAKWGRGRPSWEKSLGLIPHRGGHFTMRLRDEIVRKAHQLSTLLHDAFEMKEEVDGEWEEFEEAYKPPVNRFGGSTKIIRGAASKASSGPTMTVKTGGITTKRELMRGMKKAPLSQTSKTVLKGMRGVISDQEKSFLENTLRGMDHLARNHANELYDVTTSSPTKQELLNAVDKFKSGNLNKKQLTLSIQTHVRAMMRRLVMDPQFEQKMGVKAYLQVPPTRSKDTKPSKSTRSRAFKIVPADEARGASGGKGDSLGQFPGDQVQNIPIPPGMMKKLEQPLSRANKAYLQRIMDAFLGDDEE